MKEKSKPSILLSIFKRKGGEGILTKILDDENESHYRNQVAFLKKDETALLCFKENESNWLLLTSSRILAEREGKKFFIPFAELVEVNLAVQEEFNDGIVNKEDFTRLALKDSNDRKYILKCEKGRPFQGVYQILHYIASGR